jgi:serine O-acetyltransferase
MPSTHVRPERFWENFRADLDRHFVYHPDASTARKVKLALEVDGLWALSVYRWDRSLTTATKRGVLHGLARGVCSVARTWVRLVTGIHLDPDAKIGPGFYIGHFGSIYVGPGVEIGKQSSISQLCHVAAAGPVDAPGTPVVGERVYLGTGCKVLGGVRVGPGAAVGANAVVMSDVPPNAVVAGVPASVISDKGSGDFIYLGEREGQSAAG